MFAKSLLSLLLVSIITLSAEQPTGVVYSSYFTACWATLPTPDKLQLIRREGSDPAKPGRYSLAVSLVDKDGVAGPMSDPTTLDIAVTNWSLRIRPAPVSKHTQACAWILWCRREADGENDDYVQYEWRPFNGRESEQVRPFLPLSGLDSHATRSLTIKRAERRDPSYRWKPYEDNTYWPKTTELAKPQPPAVEVLHVPNVATEVCFAWVGNDGESLPSPSLMVPAIDWGSEFSSPVRVARIGVAADGGGVLPPNGALGMYVYVKASGPGRQPLRWHRQPAPHVGGVASTPDDYLWPLAMQQFSIERIVKSGVAPATTAGRSWLSTRNRAVYESQKSVIIDTDDSITCPIISPHKIGGNFYDHRTIAGEIGQRWNLTTAISTPPEPGQPNGVTGYPTSWPMWIETAQHTRLVGCHMESQTASVGIDLMSYMGSSCFHFRTERIFIALYRPVGERYTCGIRALAEARGTDNHSPSEPLFVDTEINARHPLVVEYEQSANWQMHNSTLLSYTTGEGYSQDCEPAIFSINNSGNFKATGRTTTDGARCLLACLSAKQVKIDEEFSDQGHQTLVVFATPGGSSVSLTLAASNHQEKSFLHVAEAPVVGAAMNSLTVEGNSGNQGWHDENWGWHQDVEACIFSSRYCGVTYSLSAMPLLDLLSPPLPAWSQWQSMAYTSNSGQMIYYSQAWDAGIDPATKKPMRHALGR